jgi:hypothetical protein
VITKIIEALNTGFPQVPAISFGDEIPPTAPYVVVKQEPDTLGRGTAYRVIAHYRPGQQTFLEDYIKITVTNILKGFTAVDRNGNNHRLEVADNRQLPGPIEIENDDNTISLEKVYLQPGRMFV